MCLYYLVIYIYIYIYIGSKEKGLLLKVTHLTIDFIKSKF